MAEDLSTLVANMRIGAENIPPPANVQRKDGFSSVYQFDVRPTINGGALVFRYDVELTDMAKGKSLTTGGGDDGKKGLLRSICFELMRTVSEGTKGFGVGAEFVYDNRKILYTNVPIQPLACEIAPDQMTAFTRAYLRNNIVKVEIHPCQTEAQQLDLNVFGAAQNHSLRTFLEMLTSQPFINAGSHDIIGAGRLFEKRIVKELGDGIVTRFGIAKGVRVISNEGTPKLALAADVKTCAFFGAEQMERVVKQMMAQRRIDDRTPKDRVERFWKEVSELFRGVSGYLTYAPSRVIVIDSVTACKMDKLSFESDGVTITMVDFFAQKKKINVDGNMPAVRQQNDRDTYFPMSCIMLLPNQRVPIDKMGDFISRELLNANTTHPDVRYKAIENELRKIGTGDCLEFMAKFGVKLVGGCNNVKIGVHEMPKVKFGGEFQARFTDKISPGVRYLEPSNVLKIWIVAYPRAVPEPEVKRFVGELSQMGRRKGMQIPDPSFEPIEMAELAERIEILAKNDVQFLLYIDSIKIKSHSILKLNEKRYGVLTQQVTIEVAGKARAMTMNNVLNKMNMKTWGYNYQPVMPPVAQTKFNMLGGEVLVIGLDTSRPPRVSGHDRYMLKKRGLPELQSEDPQIVGICANFMPNPFKFNGDYYFQACKQDVLEPDMLVYKLGWILDKLKTHRSKPPSVIVIIRDGVSEGMIPDNVRNEFPSYVKACRIFDPNWHPKFVYCIVTKQHNERFFLANGQQAMNTTPGCVVDTKVTRVDMHEFWLQSHVPLKGTANMPQYTIPINEIGANNDELQSFMLTMCSNWQIVNLAPALPTPVRQAAELAKRGRNNYMEMKRNSPQYIPRETGTNQIDYQTLNNRLCYNGHPFSNTRFNA